MEFNQHKTKATIKEAIVKTIAFFDLFDYPLTNWEIWRYGLWQGNKITYNDVVKILDTISDPTALKAVGSLNGFYFLPGRDKIIKTRRERYNYTNRKFKRALLIAKIFKFIPWIKMIAVGNLIGTHNLKDESDIDFFIVTEPGRIWLTRFFCVSLTQLLGLRPKEGKMRDKICLSFFISEEAIDLSGLMIVSGPSGTSRLDKGGSGAAEERVGSTAPPAGRDYEAANEKLIKDIYFIYWLACLVPIYDKDGTYNKLIKKNDWLKQCLPNWQQVKIIDRRNLGRGFSNFYREVVDLLIGGLEQNIKRIQFKLMPHNLKAVMNKGSKVMADDLILKLHVNDRREEYMKRWKEKLVEIELLNWTLE